MSKHFYLVPQSAVGSQHPKETARLSFSKRNLLYIWLTADIKWKNAKVMIQEDFSSITLTRCNEDIPSYVIRPPDGKQKRYPCIHIRPQGFKVKPFSLCDASGYIIKRDIIAIGIPKEFRDNFSRIN